MRKLVEETDNSEAISLEKIGLSKGKCTLVVNPIPAAAPQRGSRVVQVTSGIPSQPADSSVDCV